MDATQASEAGRNLVSVRWRGQVINKAIATLAQRSGELTPEQLADLRAIADTPELDGTEEITR